jgi:hypothetical protein
MHVRARQERETRGGGRLLAHDNTQSAPPAFRQTDAYALELGRENTQENICGRVKAKGRGNKIDERRSGLQFDSREISVRSEQNRAVPSAGGCEANSPQPAAEDECARWLLVRESRGAQRE